MLDLELRNGVGRVNVDSTQVRVRCGGYLALTAIILLLVAPRIGTEIFPDSNGPVLRLRLKTPVGTRIEETEPMVMQALDLIRRTAGKENVEITSDYIGVQPSSYPVNLIHLFTSRPEEARRNI